MRLVLLAAAPAAAFAVVAIVGEGGARGLFLADLAGLLGLAAAGAFALRPSGREVAALAGAAGLLAALHAAWGDGAGGTVALLWLALAAACVASGVAVLGRALRAPRVPAGTAAFGLLCAAATGLWWADPLAASLPRERRFVVRQAVLHADLATACAYDAAGYDRLHDPAIYDHVPLAASLVRTPGAPVTGGAWLVVGLLAWGAAALLRVPRAKGHVP
jgi:hypothetical protein